MSIFSTLTLYSPRPVSAADSWTVLRENDDVHCPDKKVIQEYLERVSNLERSLQMADMEYKDYQKKVKALTNLMDELKRISLNFKVFKDEELIGSDETA
ncbi:hypothetical protein Y032_0015g2546 [Ancylostoma ceylanicum]|uniref:Uncharacterized protein n=1 Tax=Ancylostoma ceylanicum TaxID=53326 RepID=A0A016V6E4_9BILA|nr:hypothetical protein Y032_0015g2546 [Ancylostoma ceylanicum]